MMKLIIVIHLRAAKIVTAEVCIVKQYAHVYRDIMVLLLLVAENAPSILIALILKHV